MSKDLPIWVFLIPQQSRNVDRKDPPLLNACCLDLSVQSEFDRTWCNYTESKHSLLAGLWQDSMVLISVLHDALKTMYNAEKRGKRQVLLRPSSKVVIKFLQVMMKHGTF